MGNREINEALKSLREIRELFAERTREGLKTLKHQFLVWGSYQIVLPVVVYYTKRPIYFMLLLPVFFFLSLIKTQKIFLSFIYWTFSLILYFLLVKTGNATLFYIFFILSILLGFWIFSEKSSTRREKLSGLFWLNTIVFALMFQMVFLKTGTPSMLYFSWSAIILFALGFIGVFGEVSLLLFSIIGNITGALYFTLTTPNLQVFTPAVFGTLYIVYYIYISIKLKKYHG